MYKRIEVKKGEAKKKSVKKKITKKEEKMLKDIAEIVTKIVEQKEKEMLDLVQNITELGFKQVKDQHEVNIIVAKWMKKQEKQMEILGDAVFSDNKSRIMWDILLLVLLFGLTIVNIIK